jgi:23S rRNA (cytidine1920-2'-O)/16S rRNA (cytidine1409-2'-O)-methyltransferase
VKKTRADIRLVELGLVESRTRAQARILAGQVFFDSRRIEKAGDLVPETAELRVTELERYCSRGGKKLEGALLDLNVDVTGLVAVDVGASTGGFTDCLLQHGAIRVYAVDVGHGQLAEKLRQDARVVIMDRTNARHLTPQSFPERIALTVVDASFISLDKLLPAISQFSPPGCRLLALIKPQFEVGREEATRTRGVVTDDAVRARAVAAALSAVEQSGFHVLADCPCRVPGPKGNVEHFVLAQRTP